MEYAHCYIAMPNLKTTFVFEQWGDEKWTDPCDQSSPGFSLVRGIHP